MGYLLNRYKKYIRRSAAFFAAAGLFAAPIYAEAADGSKITNADGNSLITNESVHNLYAQGLQDGIAVSRYTDFNLAQKEIANMYFRTSANGADGNYLVNLVKNQIDINGTVNAIQNNRVGGEIFFLSPNGVAVGSTGVINAGAVNLIVPTAGDFNHLWGQFNGSQWDEDFNSKVLKEIDEFDNGSNPWNSDDDPGISVKGAINARSGILLGATKIDIASGATLTSRKDIDFSSLVNISGGPSAGLSNVNMTARSDDKSGDILLTANAKNEADDNTLDHITNNTNFVLLSKKTNMAATINVDGAIKGDAAVTLDATSSTSFQEGEIMNVLSQTGLLDKILGGGGVDIAADWVDKTGKAEVTVGENGSITSGDALTLNARSDIKIRLDTVTPAVKTGNLTGSFLPTTALDVVLFNNDATVDVTGSLASSANVTGLDTVAASGHMTKLTATAASTAITVARAATRTKPVGGVDPDLVYAAVLVEKGDTNASVNLHNNAGNSTNNAVTSTADLAAVATAVTALDSTVAAVAPSGSVASGAIGYIDYDSNASVNIDKPVSARSVTVNADNHLMRDSLTVSSSLGDADPTVKNPFIIKNKDGTAPGTGMVDALLNPLLGKLTKITDKVDFASGKMSAWRTSGIGKFEFQDLLKSLKLGMSVAATDQHNVSSVRLGQNAAVTAGGPASLSSKTHADYDGFDYSDYMKFSAVGELNTQKTSKTAKVMVAGSVVGASVENDSVITFESKDGKAASLTSQQGAVTVKADTNMSYNPLESGIKFAVGKLQDFGKALEAAGVDCGETINEIDKDLWHLHDMDGITAAQGVMDILFNFENVFLDVVDDLDSTTDAYKAAKVAYNAVISLLDPATFTNYYSRTQAKSNALQGSTFDVTGTLNVDILKNRATVLADENVKFNAAGNVDLGAGTKTSTVAMSGNGGKYFTTNQSTGSGLGATFAVQDISASSLLMLGKGVSVTSGKDVNLTADNQMIQTDIIYGAGESKGTAAINGMLGVITGASDSVVAVDDEAKIQATNKAAITADNDTTVTGIAGGATLGGTQTYAAVGASLLTVAYDVNNYALVSDNGTDVAIVSTSLTEDEKKQIASDVDADINAGKLDKGSRDAEIAAREDEALQAKKTPESAAAQTISDGVQLAHTMAGNAKVGEQDGDGVNVSSLGTSGYAGIGTKTQANAARGSIKAADFSATANTDGVINSVAVEGTSVSNSHPAVDAFNKYVGKAETFVGMLPQAANWPMDKVSKIIGGKIEGKLNKNKAADALGRGANGANPNGAAPTNLATKNEVQAAIQIGGAGSVSVNLADGETAAIVDNIDVDAQNVALTADDFLFKGAWAGAAALNWNNASTTGGTVPQVSGSIGGALALNSSSRDVDAILREAKVTNASKIENSAEKSGADVAVALGVGVSKSNAATQGTVAASVSYNMADSDVHALMINDNVTGSSATIENKAADADVQIAGGVSAAVNTGNAELSLGVGGSAAANRVRSDIESGVIGGNYSGVKDFGVDAVKSVNQIDAAVAAAFANSKEGAALGFTGAVAYNDVDNTAKAFIDRAAITASNTVAVEANDTLGLHRYDDYLTARGVDPSGTSFFGENAQENAKDPKGGAIVGAAVAGEYAGDAGAGIAILYSAAKNDMTAEVKNSNVTASSLRAQATDRTTLVSTALGASMGGEYFSGAGAVSWNDIQSGNTASLEDNTIKADSVEGKTLNESRIVDITGEGAGGKGAAMGFNFSFNDLDNTSNASLLGGSVAAKGSNGLALNLETQNREFDFALGLGVSVSTKTGALAGTAAVTTGSSSAESTLGDASGQKRTTVNDVKSINVSAKDSATKVTTGGAVDVSNGSYGAVGVSIAYADIGGNGVEKLQAGINHSDITTKSGATIHVKAEDKAALGTTAVGAGVSIGKDFANVQGAAAASEMDKAAGASVKDSKIDETTGGKNAVVTVTSDSENKIWTTALAPSVAPGGTIAAGAAISVSKINHQTDVSFNNTTANLQTLSLYGNGYSDIEANAAGVGIGNTVGLAGSFAYDYIKNDISAAMDNSTVNANGSIGVVAQSDEEISNYAGAVGGSGTVGIGLSVNINEITGNTKAGVTNSTLAAKGNDSGITVKSDVKDEDIIAANTSMDNYNPRLSGKRKESTKKGVVVDASATHAIASDIVTAGFAGDAGLVGTFNENFIKGTTSALMQNTDVNSGVTTTPASNQDVSVRAADYMNLGTFAMSAAGAGYAAVGVTEHTNILERDVSAQVVGKSSSEKAVIKADEFKAEAVSKKGTGNIAATGAVSGEGATVLANVLYDGLKGKTLAHVENTDVTFANAAKVSADSLNKANMAFLQGSLNGIGAGLALSAGVIEQSSDTNAEVIGSSISGGSGSAEVTANNRTSTRSAAATGALAAEGFGGAGTVFVNQFANVVGVTANNAKIEAGSVKLAANNDLKTESYGGSAAIAGLGASLGISTLYNSVSDKVFVDVTDEMKTTNGNTMYFPSTINAKSGDLTISAATSRDFTQGVASISGAAFAGVAVNYLGEYINSAVDNADLKTKIAALNDPTQTKTLSASDFQGLTTDEKDDVEKRTYFSVWDAPQTREGIGDGIHVRVLDSTAKASGATNISVTEKNDLMANGDAGGLGIAGVSASAVDVRAKHDNGISLEGAEISGKTLNVKAATRNGEDNEGLHVVSFTGSAGGGTVEALESVAKTEGTTAVDVKGGSLSATDALNIAAEDAAKIKADSVSMSFGIYNIGGLYTKAENTSTTGVSFSGANVSGGTLAVSAKKQNAVDVMSIAGVYTAGAGTSVDEADAKDTGSASVTISGSGNKFTAGSASFTAENSPTISLDLDQDGGGLIPGMISHGDVDISSGAAVMADAGNTFNADTLSFASKVNATGKSNVASVSVSGMDLNVAGDRASVNSMTRAATDIGAENYAGKGGNAKGTALTVSAENKINKEIDIFNANVGVIEVACADIEGKAESRDENGNDAKDVTEAKAAGGDVRSLSLSATGSSYVDNNTSGNGGGAVEAGNLAHAVTKMNGSAAADLSGTWNIGGGDVNVSATQTNAVDYQAFSGSGGAINVTGVSADLTMDGSAATSAANSAKIDGAGKLGFKAENVIRVNQGGKYAYNAYGASGSLSGGQDGRSAVGTTGKSAVSIGEGASFTSSGAQTYEAHTDVALKNLANATACGLISENSNTYADTDVTTENTVNVGKNASLTNKGSFDNGGVTIAAHDDFNMETSSQATTSSIASFVSNANTTFELTRTNKVDVAGTLTSAKDVNVYAGKGVDGKASKLSNHLIAEAYNFSIAPSTSPDISNTTTEAGQVNISSGSSLTAMRDINLTANNGSEDVKHETKRWDWWNAIAGTEQKTELLGSANGNVNYGQTKNNFVNIDGSLTSGKRNQLTVTIDGAKVPDGAIIDGTNNSGSYRINISDTSGELKDLEGQVIVKTFDYGKELMDRWNELTNLINEYQDKDKNNAAYNGYVAERAIVEAQMKQLGLGTVAANGDFVPTAKTSPNANYYKAVGVELPDLVASGGNIRVASDNLTGNGSLTAQGSPTISIKNTSNAYLKLNDIQAGDEGGSIYFNDASLPDTADKAKEAVNKQNYAGTAAFKTVSVDNAGANTKIDVYNKNGYPKVSYSYKDEAGQNVTVDYRAISTVEIAGKVSAPNGAVTIKNESGSVIVDAGTNDNPTGIFGATIDVSAKGTFATSYMPGAFSVGGAPEEVYGSDKHSASFNYNYGLTGFPPIDTSQSAHVETPGTEESLKIKREQEAYTPSAVVADGDIVIWANDINVNGLLQSGYASYSVSIDQAAVDRAKENAKNHSGGTTVNDKTMYWVTGGDHVATGDGMPHERRIAVYYDRDLDQLVTEDVVTQGGSVTLIGNIVNTSMGDYQYYGETRKQTNYGRIAAARGGAEISITNDSDTALIVGKIVNNDRKGSVSITDTLKNSQTTTFTTDGTYNPATNAIYTWTDGNETTTVETYQNDHKEFLDIDFLDYTDEEKRSLESDSTRIGTNNSSGSMLPGAYAVVDNNFNRSAVSNTTTSYRVTGDNEYDTEEGKVCSPSTTTEEWHGLNKHYITTWTETWGSRQIYTHSILADNPIAIDFIGKDTGNINIASKGGVTFTDEVRSHKADSAFTVSASNGAINQADGTVIHANNISLSAQGDISGINISTTTPGDGKAITLSAESQNGSVDIVTGGADVSVNKLYAAEKAGLVSGGDIMQVAGAGTPSVKGSRIDLTAAGAVGTKDSAFVLQGGQTATAEDPMAASVNITAQRDINVSQQSGDLRVGRIESAIGDVTLTAADGRILDATPNAELASEEYVNKAVKRWADAGAIADHEVGADYVGATTKANQQAVTSYETAARKAWDQYDARKAYYSDPTHQNETDQNYQLYKKLDAKFSGYASVDDYLAAQAGDASSQYAKVRNVAAAQWTKDMMLYTLRDAVVNKQTGSTDENGKLANVVGNNITLRSGKGIGEVGAEQETIQLAWLKPGYVDANGKTNVDYLKDLTNANDTDITVNRNSSGAITSFDIKKSAPLGVYGRKNSLGTEGALLYADSVTTKDGATVGDYGVYIAARGKSDTEVATQLTIDQIVTSGNADVRVLGKKGVTATDKTAETDASRKFDIIGKNLIIEGGSGALGGSAAASPSLHLALSGMVTARAEDNISIKNYYDGNGDVVLYAGRPDLSYNALQLGAVYSAKDVFLGGYDSILMGKDADPAAYVNAGTHLTLYTTPIAPGAIGTEDEAVRVLANGTPVGLYSGEYKYVHLAGVRGTLSNPSMVFHGKPNETYPENNGVIHVQKMVVESAGNLYFGRDDLPATILANVDSTEPTVTLSAERNLELNGDIISRGSYLDDDGYRHFFTGAIDLTAGGNITQNKGGLKVGTVTTHTGGGVTLMSDTNTFHTYNAYGINGFIRGDLKVATHPTGDQDFPYAPNGNLFTVNLYAKSAMDMDFTNLDNGDISYNMMMPFGRMMNWRHGSRFTATHRHLMNDYYRAEAAIIDGMNFRFPMNFSFQFFDTWDRGSLISFYRDEKNASVDEIIVDGEEAEEEEA